MVYELCNLYILMSSLFLKDRLCIEIHEHERRFFFLANMKAELIIIFFNGIACLRNLNQVHSRLTCIYLCTSICFIEAKTVNLYSSAPCLSLSNTKAKGRYLMVGFHALLKKSQS